MGNERYINVPTLPRVAACPRGVKRWCGVIQESGHPMLDDLEMRRRRAAYRASHRGTKEMDIILGRYAAARLGSMSAAELSAFERFLALPDPLLTQWFSQGASADQAGELTGEFAQLIVALRAHHGLAPAVAGEGLENE
jgi:antitoxin CptB